MNQPESVVSPRQSWDLLTRLVSHASSSFLLKERITNVHLAVGVWASIEGTAFKNGLGLIKSIDLNLAILQAHWVVDLVVLAVRVDVADFAQDCIQFALLGPTLFLRVGLVSFSCTHLLVCCLLLKSQLIHL